MNQTFYEGETLLAEITDSLLIAYKETQAYEYRLDSLTGAYPVISHESEPEHVVFFGAKGGSEQTIAVVWTERAKAEDFRNAVTSAVLQMQRP